MKLSGGTVCLAAHRKCFVNKWTAELKLTNVKRSVRCQHVHVSDAQSKSFFVWLQPEENFFGLVTAAEHRILYYWYTLTIQTTQHLPCVVPHLMYFHQEGIAFLPLTERTAYNLLHQCDEIYLTLTADINNNATTHYKQPLLLTLSTRPRVTTQATNPRKLFHFTNPTPPIRTSQKSSGPLSKISIHHSQDLLYVGWKLYVGCQVKKQATTNLKNKRNNTRKTNNNKFTQTSSKRRYKKLNQQHIHRSH